MNHYATRAYASTAVRTSVDDASPHQLILMLYDGALRQTRMAKTHIQNGNIAGKAQCISKAVDIIGQGLRMALNEEKGGEVARNLSALYDFCEQRLVQANARNEAKLLDDVVQVMEPLREAWLEIKSQVTGVTVGG